MTKRQARQRRHRMRRQQQYRPLRSEILESRIVLDGSGIGTAWQNPINPHDLNLDSRVTPQDALVGINAINEWGAGELADLMAPPILQGHAERSSYYLDASGDGRLAPDDILAVINEINQGGSGASVARMDSPNEDDHVDSPGPDATEIVLHDGYGVADGFLGSDDTDVFQIVGEPGRLALSGFGLGDFDFDGLGFGGELQLEILDEDLNPLAADSEESGHANCPGILDLDLEEGEVYFILVNGTTGNYVLELFSYDEVDWMPGSADSLEDDHADVIGADATPISFVDVAAGTGSLQSDADVDVFEFELTQSEFVSLAAIGFGNLDVGIVDAAGNAVVSGQPLNDLPALDMPNPIGEKNGAPPSGNPGGGDPFGGMGGGDPFGGMGGGDPFGGMGGGDPFGGMGGGDPFGGMGGGDPFGGMGGGDPFGGMGGGDPFGGMGGGDPFGGMGGGDPFGGMGGGDPFGGMGGGDPFGGMGGGDPFGGMGGGDPFGGMGGGDPFGGMGGGDPFGGMGGGDPFGVMGGGDPFGGMGGGDLFGGMGGGDPFGGMGGGDPLGGMGGGDPFGGMGGGDPFGGMGGGDPFGGMGGGDPFGGMGGGDPFGGMGGGDPFGADFVEPELQLAEGDLAAGTYFVMVSDGDSDLPILYSLDVLVGEDLGPAAEVDDFDHANEAGNDASQLNFTRVGFSAGILGDSTDIDVFRITLEQDDSFSIISTAIGGSMSMQVVDVDGNVVLAASPLELPELGMDVDLPFPSADPLAGMGGLDFDMPEFPPQEWAGDDGLDVEPPRPPKPSDDDFAPNLVPDLPAMLVADAELEPGTYFVVVAGADAADFFFTIDIGHAINLPWLPSA